MTIIHATIPRISADDLDTEVKRIERYLSGNWEVTRVLDQPNEFGDRLVEIVGEPRDGDGGWSATGYIIPRLASGMIFAEVIG